MIVQYIDARGVKMDSYASEGDVLVEFYSRDAEEVIKSQMRFTPSESIITKESANSSVLSYPMNSDLGYAAEEAERIIKESVLEGIY